MVKFGFFRFARDTAGTVVTLFAFMLPVLGGLAMFGIDYAKVMSAEVDLQDAADASALAAARELLFISQGDDVRNEALNAVARNIAESALELTGGSLATQAQLVEEDIVRVDLALEVDTFFGKVIDRGGSTIRATATAEIYGANNICVIALEPTDRRFGIKSDQNARMVANKCAIHSNSRSTRSIGANDSAYFEIESVCVSGGFEGSDSNFSSPVTTDCPMLDDPLAGRPEPLVDRQCRTPAGDEGPVDKGLFEKYAMSLTGGTHQLEPGSYCGGLYIADTADVWMQPGEYNFVDGRLTVTDDAKLSGEHVGLFFTGKESLFTFKKNADIELTAPLEGAMAGILLRADRSCAQSLCALRKFEITSAKVRSMLGTIYLPVDDLHIDTTMPVSEEAAFTILVVDQLSMSGSPTLVLNTDYAATQVPVPDGFKSNADGIRLTH